MRWRRRRGAPAGRLLVGQERSSGAHPLGTRRCVVSSGSAAAALGCAAARLLEPAFGGLERGALPAMARIPEARAGLRTPALGCLAVADAHEVAVRPRGFLVDAADAGGQTPARGGAWHSRMTEGERDTAAVVIQDPPNREPVTGIGRVRDA